MNEIVSAQQQLARDIIVLNSNSLITHYNNNKDIFANGFANIDSFIATMSRQDTGCYKQKVCELVSIYDENKTGEQA